MTLASQAILPPNAASTSGINSTLNPTNKLTNPEPLPGSSPQMPYDQQQLHNWLIKIKSQFEFVSEFENTESFNNLVSVLNSEKETEEKCLEFLLALENFYSVANNTILLPTRFIIEKILNNTEFLIRELRDCYKKMIVDVEIMNQTDVPKQLYILQTQLQELKTEKKKLELDIDLHDSKIARLHEFTRDIKKLNLEKKRNFETEIGECETKLENHKRALENLDKILNEKVLETPYSQVNLKSKQRKLNHLKSDLTFLNDLVEQIDQKEINKSLVKLLNLENARSNLISELAKYDAVAILRQEVEQSKIDLDKLRTEEKIIADLTNNTQQVDDLIEFLKDIKLSFPIRNQKIIKDFVFKIESILNIISNKRKLENKILRNAKEVKNLKTQHKVKENDNVQAFQSTLDINQNLSEEIHSTYSNIHNELVTFIENDHLELKNYIQERINDKQKEIHSVKKDISILESFFKRFDLINRNVELEGKKQAILNDQCVFKSLNPTILEKFAALEKLQSKLEKSIKEIDVEEKNILETEKKIKELQLDQDTPPVQLNKKMENLVNKKRTSYHKLGKLKENHENELKLDLEYRDQIEQYIEKQNELFNISPEVLAQNEQSLKLNLLETKQIEEEISKLETIALNNTHNMKIKVIQNHIKNQLFQAIQQSSENGSTQQENMLFDSLKQELSSIKDIIENPIWNKSGWSFFHKKLPDGIQKLRAICNESFFNNLSSAPDDDHVKLSLLELFSKVKFLIDNKTITSNFFRCQMVKDLYQSLQTTLNQVYTQFIPLQNSETERNENLQPTCN